MRTDVMHVFTAQLAFSLCGLLGFVKSHSRNMVTACNNSRLSVALARPQTRQKLLLTPSNPYCVIASNTSSVLDGLPGRLLLHQLIIILVIGGFSAIPAPSLQTLWPCTGNNTRLASSSACSVIALASSLAASSQELLSLFTGFSA